MTALPPDTTEPTRRTPPGTRPGKPRAERPPRALIEVTREMLRAAQRREQRFARRPPAEPLS
jgi:hypothetical protein